MSEHKVSEAKRAVEAVSRELEIKAQTEAHAAREKAVAEAMKAHRDIRCWKLVGGGEVIGELLNGYLGPTMAWLIGKPRQLFPMSNQRGQIVQIGVMPYVIGNEDVAEITLKCEHILFEYLPSEAIVKAYVQSTTKLDLTSHIQLPQH